MVIVGVHYNRTEGLKPPSACIPVHNPYASVTRTLSRYLIDWIRTASRDRGVDNRWTRAQVQRLRSGRLARPGNSLWIKFMRAERRDRASGETDREVGRRGREGGGGEGNHPPNIIPVPQIPGSTRTGNTALGYLESVCRHRCPSRVFARVHTRAYVHVRIQTYTGYTRGVDQPARYTHVVWTCVPAGPEYSMLD